MATYKADIAGGALKVYESRIVADLMLRNVKPTEWRRAIEVENVLQKTSPNTAKRQATLIRSRLATQAPRLWEMVRDGSRSVATQAMFVAAVAHSALLRDFLNLTVRDHFRAGNLALTRGHWRAFVEACRERDPDMTVWSGSTIDKLGDSAFQILAEVGMLSEGEKPMLQPVYYQPEILEYLNAGERSELLRSLQAFI